MATTTAQKISFVNKISSIMKATSDDENPTAGYLYKEINDISFESVGYSESLVEFLVDRVKHKSCHVKFKVLKLMKHVVENGSREFQLGLRRHSDVIKECTKFGGPPHPMHGNVPYLMVRKIAKELCEILYNSDSIRSPSGTGASGSEKPADNKYGGWGTFNMPGPVQGFGNTPTNQSKGLGETILDGIEKLGAKMSESVVDRQAALLAKLDLTSSTINYQPPAVVAGNEEPAVTPSSTEEGSKLLVASSHVRRPVKKHLPGKAGGGWGDDDDDEDDKQQREDNENNNDSDSKQQSIETDSLVDPANRGQSEEPQADWREESELVSDFLRKGSTGLDKVFLSPSTTTLFMTKCASLSCDKVVELLGQKLASQDAGVVIRALQLLEGIIYNREELVGVDLLASTCKEALVNCYLNCQSRLQSPPSSLATKELAESMKLPENNGKLWGAVQVKSAKIILILQQLSSHKEILPASHFSDYLTCAKPAASVKTP